MAKRDQITNRGPLTGNSRSKALNITKRRWNLNLQKATVQVGPNKFAKVRISTKTMRTLEKLGKLA